MRATLVAAMILLLVPGLSSAQIRPEPGVVINGKVAVRVYVTLRDEETPYFPVANLELRFFRNAKDSVIVKTDDAGAVTTLLAPGEYRLVSSREVYWKGSAYSWSIPLTVWPGMPAIDLREAASSPNATRVVLQDKTPATAGALNGSDKPSGTTSVAERSGFWMSLGFGVGSLSCDDCDGRETGWGGSLALGGTLNRRLLIGIFTNAMSKTSDRIAFTAGAVTAGMRAYPSASSGFFFSLGLGVSSMITDVSDVGATVETGAGGLLGAGWDLKIGASTSLTIFWNGIGMYGKAAGNFGQAGLGITWN